MKRLLFLAVLALLSSGWLSAQSALFSPALEEEIPAWILAEEELPVRAFSRLQLDNAAMLQQLANAPAEGQKDVAELTIQLPTPDGGVLNVRVEDSPVMHPDLAAKYPQIKSYRAFTEYGVGRIAVSPNGMTAAIMGEKGEFFISPAVPENNVHHVTYYNKDLNLGLLGNAPELSCGWDADQAADDMFFHGMRRPNPTRESAGSPKRLVSMYVYDLALTCTGEFANLKGGTTAGVMAAFNEAVTLLNAILERENASRFQLIANNDILIFLDPATDPYNNSNEGGALLGQVRPAIVGAGIPVESFDLGHIFTGGCTDVGGVVSGQACTPGKMRGVTCHYSQSIPGIVRRVMSHEIAHQFAVGHSWNNCPPSSGQLASGSAFEPGSGTTIMSYAGSCGGANNVAGDSDDYYHVGSLDQFQQFTREIIQDCATILEPVNNAPEITLEQEDGFYIPISTPFILTGSATDEDGDELQYNWEQYDLGPSRDLGNPTGNSPLFRSFSPRTDGNTRVFPRLNNVINNTSSNVEVLPTYSRDMTFRLTARDNNPAAGAATWATLAFHATEEAGPFLVTYPNDGTESLKGGDYVEVTWDVANTNQAPVNCQVVNVKLSLDGGLTYPITLLENASNVGAAYVTIPADVTAGNARIKVEAADNIFFDISNNSFPITAPTEPGFTLEGPQYYPLVCLPETVTATFNSGSILDFNENIALTIREDMLPAGITATLSTNNIMPGESAEVAIELRNSSGYDGTLDVVLEASVGDTATIQRVITLNVVNSDYSDLNMVTPAEGNNDIQLAANFDWSDAQYADSYDFQLATSPNFSQANMFDQATDLTETAFQQSEFFEANTMYYWRVRAKNECGNGRWLDPRSFRTINVDCATSNSTDTPLILPGSFTTRTSELFVENNGTISDINIPNIDIVFQSVRSLSIILESPAGTRVTLYQRNCPGFTNRLNLGFDDDAPDAVACPPDDQRVFMPFSPLSAFNGENTFGTWKLELRSNAPGQTGNLASWSIQFCAGINAQAPFVVNNNPTSLSVTQEVTIPADNLRVQDDNFGATDVTYTLVRKPRFGKLKINGSEIYPGATFTQQDVEEGKLSYENTNAWPNIDDFSFVALNPDGGYLPVNYHEFLLSGSSTVAEEASSANVPEVFPNPVNSELQLRWTTATTEVMPGALLDVTGRKLQSFTLPAHINNYQLNLAKLPAGIYFLQIGAHTERIVKR